MQSSNVQFRVGQRVILKSHEVWPELAGKEAAIEYAAESGISNEGNVIGEHYSMKIDGMDVGAWPDMLELANG